MKVLVTGGAGFIGSHTVDALLKDGHDVRILDNLQKPVHLKGKPAYVPDEAEFILGDVRRRDDMEKALKDVDAVYHLAAYQDYLPDFSRFFDVNATSTALLYEIAVANKLPLQKIIVASSQAVYGEGMYRCDECARTVQAEQRSRANLEAGIWEVHCARCKSPMQYIAGTEDWANPQNQYAISKLTQEKIALNLGRRYDLPTVAMRYSIVQGPRQSFYNAYSGANRIFALSLYLHKAPPIYEDGKQLRDFVNIEDVVRANLLVLTNEDAHYQAFNVGGGVTCTVMAFFGMACDVFDEKVEPLMQQQFRVGDTRHAVSDIGALKKLGWRPLHNPEKSIRDYRDYLMQHRDVEDVLEYASKEMAKMNVVLDAQKAASVDDKPEEVGATSVC